MPVEECQRLFRHLRLCSHLWAIDIDAKSRQPRSRWSCVVNLSTTCSSLWVYGRGYTHYHDDIVAGLHRSYERTEVTGRKETFFAQVWNWWLDLVKLSKNLAHVEAFCSLGDLNNRYLNHLWTNPIHCCRSTVVFVFCTIVCKLSARLRMLTWILTIGHYCHCLHRVYFLQEVHC